MSFTLYARGFSPRYGGCCRTTCLNNDIAPRVTNVYISGYEYGVQPVIRDIGGNKIIPLDTFIHQASGTLTLRLPSPPLYPCRFFIETCDDVQPFVQIEDICANVECVSPIRDGYYLWCVTW